MADNWKGRVVLRSTRTTVGAGGLAEVEGRRDPGAEALSRSPEVPAQDEESLLPNALRVLSTRKLD